MTRRNWVPIDTRLVKALPILRSYTLLEAVFSYQLDLFHDTVKSIRAYSRIWGWSMTKTRNFIQNNESARTDQPRNTQETVKFSFIRLLEASKEQPEHKRRSRENQAGNTTIKEKNKKKKIESLYVENIRKEVEKINYLKEISSLSD